MGVGIGNFISKLARRLSAAALLALAATSLPQSSQAQTAAQRASLGPLPADWTLALTDVVALFSGPTAEGTVTIVAPPVMTITGDIKSAIVEKAPSLIEDLFGEPRPAGDPVPLPASDAVAPGLLVPLTVDLDDGSQARVEATGYPLRGGRMQLFIVASPSTMSADNPELGRAHTLVDQWRAAAIMINDDLVLQSAGRGESTISEDGANAAPVPLASPTENPDDRIENVIFFLRFAFDGSNPSAAEEPAVITALLLKDGRVFESDPRAPADFDAATRPPGSPGTGRWKRDGEAYALAFADGTQGTAVAAAAKTTPAPAAMAFTGHFLAIGGPPSALLKSMIEFYPDGSVLLKDKTTTLSGAYAISGRSIRFTLPGQPDTAFAFGFRGDPSAPTLLIAGNRVYERVDE